MAAGEGGNTGVTIGGYDQQLRPFIYVDFLSGCWGGRPWADGKVSAGRSVQAAGAAVRRPSGSCSTSHGVSSLQK